MKSPELLVLCSECGEELGVGDVDAGANRFLLYVDARSHRCVLAGTGHPAETAAAN